MLTALTAWWIISVIVVLLIAVAPQGTMAVALGLFWLAAVLFGVSFFAAALTCQAAVDAFQFSRRLLARSGVR